MYKSASYHCLGNVISEEMIKASLKDRYTLCYPSEIVKKIGKYFVNKSLYRYIIIGRIDLENRE